MKKNIFLTLLCIFTISIYFSSCEGDNNPNNNNPNLAQSQPRFTVDLTLITNEVLQKNITGFQIFSPIIARGAIADGDGVLVRRINELFLAFELTEPNHIPGTCDLIEHEGNTILIYDCNGNISKYNSLSGEKIEGEGEFNLKSFPVRAIKSPQNDRFFDSLFIGG